MNANRERNLRKIYLGTAPCALGIGAWMLLDPQGFWRILAVPYTDPLTQTLYGAVLVGVGLGCLRGLKAPLREAPIFGFMARYKLVAAIVLLARFATIDPAPLAAWAISILWLVIAAIAWRIERYAFAQATQ